MFKQTGSAGLSSPGSVARPGREGLLALRARQPEGGASLRLRGGRVLLLPGVGLLEPDTAVYLVGDGERSVGLLFAADAAGRLCLMGLGLDARGERRWRATVEWVIRAGGGGSSVSGGCGTTFDVLERAGDA